MKKLICNIGSIALGVLASIMAFIPMFDVMGKTSKETMWAEVPFGIFSTPSNIVTEMFNLGNNGYKGIFKIIAMILVIVAIIAVALIVIGFIVELLGNKKSIFATLKKFASLALIVIAVLIAIATIIFMVSNKFGEDGMTISIAVRNWFAYLSVIIGFAGSGLLAMFAKK